MFGNVLKHGVSCSIYITSCSCSIPKRIQLINFFHFPGYTQFQVPYIAEMDNFKDNDFPMILRPEMTQNIPTI